MTNEAIADQLLWPVWRGMPENYKIKYARSIWQQFEDQIRSAAYTSSPARFFETLARKLEVTIRSDDLAAVTAVLTTGDPAALLRALRDETTYLVLLCRLRNQERREAFRKKEDGDEPPDLSIRDASGGPVFDQP